MAGADVAWPMRRDSGGGREPMTRWRRLSLTLLGGFRARNCAIGVPNAKGGHVSRVVARLSASESAFVVGTELVIDRGMIQL
jgi:hypothetical protein